MNGQNSNIEVTSNNQELNAYEDTFYIIPRYIRKLPKITLAYLDIYESIFQFWNKGKDCFLSEEGFIEKTGYKRASIYNALNYFEKHREIQRIWIKGKRYIIKPIKHEEDCIEIEPKSTAIDSKVYGSRQCTSTAVDHNIKKLKKESNLKEKENIKEKEIVASAPVAGAPCVSNKSHLANPDYEYQDTLYAQDTQKPLKKSKKDFNFEEHNPFNIPTQMLKDWKIVRKNNKSPITQTAWNNILDELKICQENGQDPVKAFKEMVTRCWSTVRYDWIKNQNGRQTKKTETLDNNKFNPEDGIYNKYGF